MQTLACPQQNRKASPTPAPLRVGITAAVLAWALIAVAAYLDVLRDLVSEWNNNPNYSHGWFVLPVTAWLLWSRRRSRPEVSASFWPGLLLIATAHASLWAGERFFLPALQRWSIPVWLIGFIAVVGGRGIARWSLPAIGFLVFMIPLPFRIELLATDLLQNISAQLSCWLLALTGTLAVTDGYSLVLEAGQLQITEACSGMRTSIAIAAVAYLFAVAPQSSSQEAGWRFSRLRAWLLLFLLPAAIFANALRISAMALAMQWFDSEKIGTAAHEIGDWASIPLAAGMLMMAVRWAERLAEQFRVGQAWPIEQGMEAGGVPRRSNRLQRMPSHLGPAVTCCSFLLVAIVMQGRLRQSHLEARFSTAAQFEASADWENAARCYADLRRYFPGVVEVRYRHALAVDHAAKTAEQRQFAWRLYASLLDRHPYHKEALKRHLQHSLRMSRPEASLRSAYRLHNIDQRSPVALQMWAEATIRFANQSQWQQILPQDVFNRLIAEVSGHEDARDSFIIAAANYCSHNRSIPTASSVEYLRSRLSGSVVRIDDAGAYLSLWRFQRVFQKRKSDAVLAKAVTRAQAGIGAKPDQMEVLLIAARVARLRRKLPDAQRLLRAAANVQKNAPGLYRERGEICDLRGDVELAQRCYEQAWQLSRGRSLDLGLKLASSCFRNGRLRQAERLVDQLADLAEKHNAAFATSSQLKDQLLVLKATLAVETGDYGEALAAIDTYRRRHLLTPISADSDQRWRNLQQLKARSLVRIAAYAEAAELFEQLARSGTSKSAMFTAAARAWEADGQRQRALDCYQYGIAAAQDLPQLWLDYVTRLRDWRGIDDAVAEVEWRDRLFRDRTGAYDQLIAQAWELVGKPRRATARYRRAAAADSLHTSALAIHLAKIGKSSEALRLVSDPSWNVSDALRAHTAAMVGLNARELLPADRKRIERILLRGQSQAPNDVAMLVAIADWYASERFTRSAIELLQEVVQQQPTHRVARNNLAMLLAGHSGYTQRALEHIDVLIAQAGPVPEYLDTKGWILLQQNRPSEAIPLLRKAAQSNLRRNPLLHLHLAAAHLAAGNRAEATKQWLTVRDSKVSLDQLCPGERERWALLESSWKETVR